MTKYRVGDVVSLRSMPNFKMTVAKCNENRKCYCVWIRTDGSLESEVFDSDALISQEEIPRNSTMAERKRLAVKEIVREFLEIMDKQRRVKLDLIVDGNEDPVYVVVADTLAKAFFREEYHFSKNTKNQVAILHKEKSSVDLVHIDNCFVNEEDAQKRCQELEGKEKNYGFVQDSLKLVYENAVEIVGYYEENSIESYFRVELALQMLKPFFKVSSKPMGDEKETFKENNVLSKAVFGIIGEDGKETVTPYKGFYCVSRLPFYNPEVFFKEMLKS